VPVEGGSLFERGSPLVIATRVLWFEPSARIDVPACFKTACTRDEACASINGLKTHQGFFLGELGVLDEAYKDRVVPDAKYLIKRRQPRTKGGSQGRSWGRSCLQQQA
jgi:hypothetical protein